MTKNHSLIYLVMKALKTRGIFSGTANTKSFKGIGIFIILCYCHINMFAQKENSFTAKDIHLEWQLVQNNYQNKPQFLSSITITNKSMYSLPSSGWRLYFNLRYHGFNLNCVTPQFKIEQVNGELFFIAPGKEFKGLKPNQAIRIEYIGTGRIANYNDLPSGLFWVRDNDKEKAIPASDFTINHSALHDTLPQLDAAKIFKENQTIEEIPESKLPKIFPTPVEYNELSGHFVLDKRTIIITDTSFKKEADYFAVEVYKLTGKKPFIATKTNQGFKPVILHRNNLPSEAYTIKVTADSIIIAAHDGAGIFYAIQSLKTLLPVTSFHGIHNSIEIPCVEVADAPRFPVREFMLDVSRNFQPKKEILRVLDLMALYKLNVFHFHLTDDEGWRIEIPGLPELTAIGAYRGFPFNNNQRLQPSYGSGSNPNNTSGSGFYTTADFIEILRYATQRHILVIPEIESPGHARAAIKAMEARHSTYIKQNKIKKAEQYLLYEQNDTSRYMSNQNFNDNVMNVALPSTYRFIEKVIDELKAMYKAADAPLTGIHLGGDEVPHGVWEHSPAVHVLMQNDSLLKTTTDIFKYYFDNVQAILNKAGLNLYSWEELAIGTQTSDDSRHLLIYPEFTNNNTTIDAWWNLFGSEDMPYKLANAGYKVILSFVDYFYFDLAYKESFDEPGDGWVGFLDIDKIFSFIPFDYYRNATHDIRGNAIPPSYFEGKEKLTEKGEQKIKGIQGAMWSENIKSPQQMEYLLVPRLLALAERAWAKNPDWSMEKDSVLSQQLYRKALSVFMNTLGKRELPRLSFYNGGYSYRIPSVGVIITGGEVMANIQLPGLEIRYTTDGSEPTLRSKLYQQPLRSKNFLRFKAFIR
jgi:hexosaminidase